MGAQGRGDDKVLNATQETGALGDNTAMDLPILGIVLVMRASITGASLIQAFGGSLLLLGAYPEA